MSLIKHRAPMIEPIGSVFDLIPSMRWFDDTFKDFDADRLIKVETFTEDGSMVVRAEMPGIDPEKDVEITVEGGVLHIKAERHEEEKTADRDFHRREFRYGSFSRSIVLPEGVDDEAVKATYVKGVLEVRAPVAAEPEKEPVRRVPITGS